MITVSGQYNQRNINKAFEDKTQELITKIDDIKNNGSIVENISIEDKETLDKELNKMNGFEVKKQRYWNWEDAKILSISLVGNTDTLSTIKTILERSGHTKGIILNETKTINQDIEDVANKLGLLIDETKNTDNKNIEEEKSKIINDKINSMLKDNNINDNLNKSIEDSIGTIPDYQKNPIQNTLSKDSTKSLETTASNLISNLINGTNSKAAGIWDFEMGLKYCGWAPCGASVFLGKQHYNGIVGTLSAGLSMRIIISKGTWWLYSLLSRVTWMCGGAIVQCNVALFAISTGIAGYIAASGASFESKCKYANWATGIKFEASLNGGINIFDCANGK
jgi:hypothetical protein